jgi:hypothetical protein
MPARGRRGGVHCCGTRCGSINRPWRALSGRKKLANEKPTVGAGSLRGPGWSECANRDVVHDRCSSRVSVFLELAPLAATRQGPAPAVRQALDPGRQGQAGHSPTTFSASHPAALESRGLRRPRLRPFGGMTVHRTVICFRLTLRFAAGELSGGGGSTLRVNSVLLHYLPPVSSICSVGRAVGVEEPKANAKGSCRGRLQGR